LFKGLYSHELLSAKLQIEAQDAELKSNGEKVETPYIEIPQESIILSKIDSATYAFDSASLKYGFEFIIDELRTESATITENNYDFSFDSLTLTLSGSYWDYSGLLFADITYKAFKWNADFISTLEPITLTFNNDFTENFTKFLELIVQFDAIPGYEMEKISETSGRIVLAEEKKDASLLKVYMYNFIEDKWDFVNFVTYDDYSGTNTFSYVVDRNFITFENYFNSTISNEFEVKLIFTVEEDVEECFVSKINFNANSIAAKIYYSTPSTTHKVNPEVKFDVDLTEFYLNSSVYLEEICLYLNFDGEMDLDDSFLFSQYALLKENYNFYLRNEYLEYELFELEDNTITLSRNEIDRLLYYDLENDKYFLRAKLEYDWNCIIEMNLGSNSKLEIISTLNLINYDLSVSYTSYEVKRISASESSVPFELAAIYAPNYIDTTNGITILDDDEELDIGIFRGFLRNVDTRQRLMLRQKLYYNFTGSQMGSYNILLDQEYTDCILRFVSPYGYLSSPLDYLINQTNFEFVSDPEVTSIEFYFHNGINYVKKGDMEKDSIDNTKFSFVWNDTEGDTGASTGDSVKIMFNLTDILGNNGQYEYTLIADFDPPQTTISLGDGSQNFQSDLIASPDTPISFNSNELDNIPSEHYSWQEDFNSFNSGYMDHNYYPDDYSSTWSMNSLNMYNMFPTATLSRSYGAVGT
jgi:hypothetical protein